MGLFAVAFPANAQAFFKQINQIASFNYINLDGTINGILNLEPTKPLNDSFNALGFSAMFFINNLGTLNLAFIAYIIGLVVLKYFESYKDSSKKAKIRYKYLSKQLEYGFIIQTMMQSYSQLTVCLFINTLYIKYHTYGEVIQLIFFVVFFVLTFSFPATLLYIKNNWKQIV